MSDRRLDEQNTNPPVGQGNRGKAPVANYMKRPIGNSHPLRKNSNPQHKDSAGYAPVTRAPPEFQLDPTLPPLGIASEPAAETYAGEGGYGCTGHTQQPSPVPAREPPAIKARREDLIPAYAPGEHTYTRPPGEPPRPLEWLSDENKRIATNCFKNAYKRQDPERLTQFALDIELPYFSTSDDLLESGLAWLKGEIGQRNVISVEETIDAWEWRTFQTESGAAHRRRVHASRGRYN
ncbi:hypothetical protein IQ07DRAFT_645226 [Pyrenochaeta sp. DS3sAY3a]|nr:hypothetical protein IQ07DRAFT_645226 [Pyrenochaeta sp. DS3sAY3a]